MALKDLTKLSNTICLLLFTSMGSSNVLATNVSAYDKSSITAIEFKLDNENGQQLGSAQAQKQIAERVIKNLAEWHFPVKQSDKHYSHTLTAKLDPITHQSTPVGFSFSQGNADPRSPEFQKADVLPISCSLRKTGSHEAPIEHEMTFSTQGLFSNNNPAQTIDKLVDEITTTCFNLLDDLKIPVTTTTNPIETINFKPSWMPSVQIVVKPVPKLSPEPISSEKAGTNSSPSSPANDPEQESDKEMIINNQGSPLTLHMGHERR